MMRLTGESDEMTHRRKTVSPGESNSFVIVQTRGTSGVSVLMCRSAPQPHRHGEKAQLTAQWEPPRKCIYSSYSFKRQSQSYVLFRLRVSKLLRFWFSGRRKYWNTVLQGRRLTVLMPFDLLLIILPAGKPLIEDPIDGVSLLTLNLRVCFS